MKAASMLTDAAALVQGDRQKAYGDPQENFLRITRLWNAYLSNRSGMLLKEEDVAMMMALVKVARAQGPENKEDNYIDGAAYIALAGQLASMGVGLE